MTSRERILAAWLTGAEGAVMTAMDAPDAFRLLMDTPTTHDPSWRPQPTVWT